jgi:sugar lactone lactonase YvrE
MTGRIGAMTLALALGTVVPAQTLAWDRGRVRTFATLPEGEFGPEGLEVDRHGNVYVTTFGAGAAAPEGRLHVFDRRGRPIRRVSIAGSTPNLLGMRLQPGTGALLVVDFGAAKVLAVDPRTGASSTFMTVPAPPPGASAGLNDITFDEAGNVYVSDSFQGIVWRTGASGGVASAWVESPLLRTAGVPPFGANGLRFDRHETVLFVANTGDDTVVEIPAAPGPSGDLVAGTPAVFTHSINGADGLLVDDDGNLWVVANQADEIVVVDPAGKVIAKLGDFGGAVEDGAPVGLLFPASARFLGDDLVVTNLALDLRPFGATAVDSEWCAQVTRYTVSRIRLRDRGDRDDDWRSGP